LQSNRARHEPFRLPFRNKRVCRPVAFNDIAPGGNMKALTWHGKGDLRCESVPDPKIEDPRDAIIKVTACAICGSDLHLLNGLILN
jgi:hypothetical protein